MNSKVTAKLRSNILWAAVIYGLVVAAVLGPAFHEELGLRIILWNCAPPTLGMIALVATSRKSRRWTLVSTIFATITAILAILLFAAWLFTSLDTDPHSLTTKLVFIHAPIVSLTIAALGAAVGWIVAVTRVRSTDLADA